jgi:hypothetical protein
MEVKKGGKRKGSGRKKADYETKNNAHCFMSGGDFEKLMFK